MMTRTRSLLIGLTACLCSLSVSSWSNFYNEKVSSLGVTAELYCNNAVQYVTAANGSEPVCWMLPDLTVLYSDRGRFQMLNDNWTLKIVNVSSEDLGLYHCVLRSRDAHWFVLRLGLNVAGPYVDDLWDKYWHNTVGAFSAFAGFLLIAVAVCLVYHFRYQAGVDERGGSASADGEQTETASVKVNDVACEAWMQSSSRQSSTFVRHVAGVYPYPSILDQLCVIECTTRL